jgi:hypothetical protein
MATSPDSPLVKLHPLLAGWLFLLNWLKRNKGIQVFIVTTQDANKHRLIATAPHLMHEPQHGGHYYSR